jgi:hypothetical protein
MFIGYYIYKGALGKETIMFKSNNNLSIFAEDAFYSMIMNDLIFCGLGMVDKSEIDDFGMFELLEPYLKKHNLCFEDEQYCLEDAAGTFEEDAETVARIFARHLSSQVKKLSDIRKLVKKACICGYDIKIILDQVTE